MSHNMALEAALVNSRGQLSLASVVRVAFWVPTHA